MNYKRKDRVPSYFTDDIMSRNYSQYIYPALVRLYILCLFSPKEFFEIYPNFEAISMFTRPRFLATNLVILIHRKFTRRVLRHCINKTLEH